MILGKRDKEAVADAARLLRVAWSAAAKMRIEYQRGMVGRCEWDQLINIEDDLINTALRLEGRSVR